MRKVVAKETSERVERALYEVQRALVDGGPCAADLAMVEELCIRTRALLLGWLTPTDSAECLGWGLSGEGLSSFEHVAYWAGQHDMTPTSCVIWVEAILRVIEGHVVSLSEMQRGRLRQVCAEGCARGRRDIARDLVTRAVAGAQAQFGLGPGCVALILSGPLDADVLALAGARFERELLRVNARSCVITCHASPVDAELLTAGLTGTLDVCRALGVRPFLHLDEPLRVRVAEAQGGREPRPVWCDSFEQARSGAQQAAGQQTGTFSRIRRVLRLR